MLLTSTAKKVYYECAWKFFEWLGWWKFYQYIYIWGGGANKWASTVSSPTEVLRKDALRESDHWGCSDISRAGAKQGHSWAVPPKRVTVPPTFLPLPSLLNVIDFESESETNKTVHIRKRLHALASVSYCTWLQRLHAYHPNPPPLHTQRDFWFFAISENSVMANKGISLHCTISHLFTYFRKHDLKQMHCIHSYISTTHAKHPPHTHTHTPVLRRTARSLGSALPTVCQTIHPRT